MNSFIAIDLGASNGRVVVGRLDGGRLTLETVHRFEHAPIRQAGHLCWRWSFIWDELLKGLAKAAELVPSRELLSISCSSWAQDFGLLDRSGKLLSPPVSYRDSRTAGLPGLFAGRISADDLIKRVGSTAHPIVTLCQLYALAGQEPDVLKAADCLLNMADLAHYRLCAEKAADWTFATASQLRNLTTGGWDTELLDQLNIPHHFLPELVESSCRLGSVKPGVLPDSRLDGLPVVVSAGHDTAAATAVVPTDKSSLFISSGTWSMMGCITDGPFIPDNPSSHGCAVFGLALRRWGLVKGAMGLWLLQECRRIQAASGLPADPAGPEVTGQNVISAQSVFDPDAPRFIAPPDMVAEIENYCRETNQPVPRTFQELAATIFTSLAFNYRATAELIGRLTGRRFERTIIFGGGSRNRLLCRMTADALEMPVIAGPPEATSAGNILIQAQVAGKVGGNEEVWKIVADSFAPVKYLPEKGPDKRLYGRFVKLKSNLSPKSRETVDGNTS